MKKPFFNKFLANQQSNENQQVITGGKKKKPIQTMKFPSDSDEDLLDI